MQQRTTENGISAEAQAEDQHEDTSGSRSERPVQLAYAQGEAFGENDLISFNEMINGVSDTRVNGSVQLP